MSSEYKMNLTSCYTGWRLCSYCQSWYNRDYRHTCGDENYVRKLSDLEAEKIDEKLGIAKTTYASGAIRYNKGKLRFDLIPPEVDRAYAQVLTYGTEKHESRNWEKGIDMLDVIASLKRHLNAWELGENFDLDSGLSHLYHVLFNSAALVTYYDRGMHELDNRTSIRQNGIYQEDDRTRQD